MLGGSLLVRNKRNSGFLTQYPGAVLAFSLRDLGGGGAVVRVRRSGDNLESDFTSNEITDGTLINFCGVSDGFVHTWYDQSGNDLHVTNSNTSQQPQICFGGQVATMNSEPTISFDPGFLLGGEVSTDISTDACLYVVGEDRGVGASSNILFSISKEMAINRFSGTSILFYWAGGGGPFINVANVFSGSSFLVSYQVSGLTANTYFNGSLLTQGGQFPVATGDGALCVGALSGSATQAFEGSISEIILYADNSPSLLDIQQNINNYYSIY